jgi:hypothetical protein
MAVSAETDEAVASPTEVDASHRLQAAAFWKRWKSRPRREAAKPARDAVPDEIPLPAEAWRHYRHFSWVIYEQRLFLLALGALLASGLAVWTVALRLKDKQPVVVRAASSLKQAAAAYYGDREVSYDQLAFFLNGCLPLLYATDDTGHPLLALAQGLVAPEIYDEAEKRLNATGPEVLKHGMTQGLTLTEVTDVIADSASGRAAAYLHGYLTVTVNHSEARFFPWRARVLVEANPVSLLNPYPFYLVRCSQRTGPQALAWDHSPADGTSKP